MGAYINLKKSSQRPCGIFYLSFCFFIECLFKEFLYYTNFYIDDKVESEPGVSKHAYFKEGH